MTKLEATLKASVYQQIAIRLIKALIMYGAHTPECKLPCSCGYAKELHTLIRKSKAESLGLFKGEAHAPR